MSDAWWLQIKRPEHEISTTDPRFRALAMQWIAEQGEILALIRYSRAGGAKDFCFYRSADAFAARIDSLPPDTSIILFKQPQLTLRGVVGDQFSAAASAFMVDDAEIIAVVLDDGFCDAAVIWGETKDEFTQELREFAGQYAVAGPYPPWLDDSEDVIGAYVPGPDGPLGRRAY